MSTFTIIKQFVPPHDNASEHALILCNGPDLHRPSSAYLSKLLLKCSWFGVLDGAADWVRQNPVSYKNNRGCTLPDVISGDFDSISKETLDYYRSYNDVKVIYTPDQDKGDLAKSFEILAKDKAEFQSIVILPALSGRLDHLFSNINSLFTALDLFPNIPTFLLMGTPNDEQSICLIKPGKTRIDLSHIVKGSSCMHCGLVPLCGNATVTSKGLKWNMNSTFLSFSGMISTSNVVDTTYDFVEITSNNYLLWILEIGDISKFL